MHPDQAQNTSSGIQGQEATGIQGQEATNEAASEALRLEPLNPQNIVFAIDVPGKQKMGFI